MPPEDAAAGAPVELTRKLWATIVNINNTRQRHGRAAHRHGDVGRRGSLVLSRPTSGDCEDYALEKRRQLMALGVPAGDLLMTVVRQPNGDGHAVLTVRTSRGDFILDNLEPRVLAWTDTDYTYPEAPVRRNSGVWVAINDGRADAVASVR